MSGKWQHDDNLLVILSLEEWKFFFDPVARLVDGKLERLTGLRWTLHREKNEKRTFNSFQSSHMSCLKKLLFNKKEIKIRKKRNDEKPHWDRVFCLMRLQGQRVHPALSGISCTPTHCTFLTPRRHTHTRQLPKHTFLFSLSQQQYIKRIEKYISFS